MTEATLYATMDLVPIQDAKNEINRLRGIVGALAYLTHPSRSGKHDDGDRAEMFCQTFTDMEERLEKLTDSLAGAIQGAKDIRV